MILNSQKDFVFAAAEFTVPNFCAFTKLTDGTAKMFQREHYHTYSLDLLTAFYDVGQFCWGRSQAITEPGSANIRSHNSLCVTH